MTHAMHADSYTLILHSSLLLASLLTLNLLVEPLTADDLLDSLLTRENHGWGKMGKGSEEGSRSRTGVLLKDHAVLMLACAGGLGASA
jgi:hypothetical protein